MDTAGPFSAVSLKQLKAPEQRPGETTCRTLPCSASGQLKAWRGMGDLVSITGCIFKIQVMCQCREVNHDWIPPYSRESHPRSAMPTFSSPPPPPSCTNLTFTVPPVRAHLSDDQPCCSCFFSPPPPPPPLL